MTTNLAIAPAPSDLATATANLQALIKDLRGSVVERDAEIRSLAAALVAGQHVLLLGPPGTGKSYLTGLFTAALGSSFFQVLMTKYTVPEEVFGPYSLAGLERDEYRRVTASYLPSVEVGFLDEVFKANSSILNALLTILNEGEFDNGGSRTKVPLKLCVGASNEFPADDSLNALRDRFLLCHWVSPIKNRTAKRSLFFGAGRKVTAKLSAADVAALRIACDAVGVPDAVQDAMMDLADELEREHGITASDRRWRQATSLVRASAVLDGRDVATTRDLSILAHVLWRTVEERATVGAVVAQFVSPKLGEAMKLYDAAVEMVGRIDRKATGQQATAALANANGELQKIAKSIRGLGTSDAEISDYADKVGAMQRDVGREVARRLGVDV
jgi:MoxR-like ATPase